MNGIILVKKEKDYTSFDVVAIMRRLLKIKKVGHLGTLDPMATGVLPVLVGKGTKLSQYLASDKEYEACFRFGIVSDTEDIWGNLQYITENKPREEDIISVVKAFIGKQNQIPPMYSARKVGGVKLYTLARQGVEIERKPKEIEIYSIDYRGMQNDGDFKIRVSCSEGTYIRTLIKNIGERLGLHAVMTELVRTKSHGFLLNSSKTLSEIEEKINSGNSSSLIVSMEEALSGYKRIDIPSCKSDKFLNGVKLQIDEFLIEETNDKLFKVYSDGKFLGLGEIINNGTELKVSLHNKGSEKG